MIFRRILYGRGHLYLFFMDTALRFFENADYISNEVIYSATNLPDLDNTMEQLEADGMIVFEQKGVRITLRGKHYIATGGYRRRALIKRLGFAIAVITCIASITALLMQFLH